MEVKVGTRQAAARDVFVAAQSASSSTGDAFVDAGTAEVASRLARLGCVVRVLAVDDERDAVFCPGDCDIEVRPRRELAQIFPDQVRDDRLRGEDQDTIERAALRHADVHGCEAKRVRGSAPAQDGRLELLHVDRHVLTSQVHHLVMPGARVVPGDRPGRSG